PVAARTHLPLVENEIGPGQRGPDRRDPIAHDERPVDLVGEPAHGHLAGARDPGRAVSSSTTGRIVSVRTQESSPARYASASPGVVQVFRSDMFSRRTGRRSRATRTPV